MTAFIALPMKILLICAVSTPRSGKPATTSLPTS
jgi:hypothetical protein